MAHRRILPGLCFFLLLTVLPLKTVADDGKLILYRDASCNQPNTILPTLPLALSTCLVPLGIKGVGIDTYPPCPNNANANLIMYKDTVCGQMGRTQVYFDTCFWIFVSTGIPSLQFSCEDPATNPRPAFTTTVTATRPLATSSAAGTSQTSPRVTNSEIPDSTGQSTRAKNPASTSEVTPSATSAPQVNRSGGFSTESKIALGVGLGVGAITIIFAILAWLFPDPLKNAWKKIRY